MGLRFAIVCAAATVAVPLHAACLLVGDSIAVRLAPFEPQCRLVAANGITSDQVVAMAPADTGFDRVIVSMGTNDWKSHAPLAANLARLRRMYPHARFAWLAPWKGATADVVADFGTRNRDVVVRLSDFPSRDTAHPDSPADVAARLG